MNQPSVNGWTERLTASRNSSALQVCVLEADGRVVCRLSGPLDIAWYGELLERVEPYYGLSARLVLDLDGVTLLDSSGIRALLMVKKEVEERDGELAVVVTPGSQPERVLKLVGLYDFFNPEGRRSGEAGD